MAMNVLMIVIDQFRADLLTDSPLGRAAKLKNLRALRDECTVFDNHYTVVSPCGPSRVSLLTAQYAMNHRAVRNGTPLRHDTPNLARSARTVRYVPRLFGYTDTTQDPRVLPADDPRLQSYEELMPGFDEAVRLRLETDDLAWREHVAAKGGTLPPYPETYRPLGDTPDSPAPYAAEDSDTAFLTDRFLEDMAGAPSGWFSLLTYLRPHFPLVAPEPYNRLYDPVDMPLPEQSNARDAFTEASQDALPPHRMVVGFPDLPDTPETTAMLRALYLGLAAEVDHHIGRVIDWLKTSGQWDNTLLIVTADHGEMLGDFGQWGKHAYHDASYHVPLMIRDPERPNAQYINGFTESIDVAVTVLERIGADIPHAMNGRSLLPLMDDPKAPARPHAVSEFDFGNPIAPSKMMASLNVHSTEANYTVLRTPQHRLVQFGFDEPPVLFDMHASGERRNIAQDPDAAPILQALTTRLLRHRMTNGDSTFARTLIHTDGVQTGSA